MCGSAGSAATSALNTGVRVDRQPSVQGAPRRRGGATTRVLETGDLPRKHPRHARRSLPTPLWGPVGKEATASPRSRGRPFPRNPTRVWSLPVALHTSDVARSSQVPGLVKDGCHFSWVQVLGQPAQLLVVLWCCAVPHAGRVSVRVRRRRRSSSMCVSGSVVAPRTIGMRVSKRRWQTTRVASQRSRPLSENRMRCR
jgi:hypothetical protein